MNTKELINKRVGAISNINADTKVAEFYGYGVYLGDYIPDNDDIKLFNISLKKLSFTNPKILLDSGDYVWGCECWWAPEEEIKNMLSSCEEIKIIPVNQYR
jgi:hypothetical protein